MSRQRNETQRHPLLPRAHRFTLVEMLAVILIMAVIMGVALPAMKSFAVGSGVNAASRMVGSQLRLARQEAITRRQRIAVLMPEGEFDNEMAYSAIRACEVDSTGAFQAFVENTKWEFLPAGAIVFEADNSNSNPIGSPGSPVTQVTGVTGASGPVRAVIFRSTGRLGHGQVFVKILEGSAETSGPQVRNGDNAVEITVDQYTGRISYASW